jgi:hypothetical protein
MKTKKQIEKSIKIIEAKGWKQFKKTAKYRCYNHPQGSKYNIYVGKLSIRRGPSIAKSWPVSIKGV